MRERNADRRGSWGSRASRGSRAIKRDRGHDPIARPGLRAPFIIIAALYVLVSTGIGAGTAFVMHNRSDPAAAIQPAKYLVLIVLDGARPDYFGLTKLPRVDALRTQGAQFANAIDGILETETPAGHTTLATGSTPARNGILGFDWMQNDNDYSLFSPDIVRAGAMEQIMESAHVPTIASLYKARFPKAKVVALSGHKYYAADPLGGPAADAIMYYQGDDSGRYVPVAIPNHTPPPGVLTAPGLIFPSTRLALGQEDTLATRLALSAFATMHQRITLINYPEFDWPLGHVDGGNLDPKDVVTLMRDFDHDLGRIEDAYRKAGVLDQTLFVITADHGMGPIKRFVPDTVVTNAVSQAGATAPAISYNTGTYVWLTDATKAQAVAQNIVNAKDPGIETVYYLTTANGKPAYASAGGSLVSSEVEAAHQYLLGTLLNGHQPNVVVFCREDQTMTSSTTQWKADHGGANWESQNIPLILSGPEIRPGTIVRTPAQLEDVAPTVLTAMGVRPTGMEGRILTEALVTPTATAKTARQAEIDQLNPLVNALIAQDIYELSH